MNPTSIRPETPNDTDGVSSTDARCPAHKSNGEPCLKLQNPADPNRCLGGHPWKGNALRGRSTQRYLDEQRERQIIPSRDRHIRDLGWTPDDAPLHVIDYCFALAELPVAMTHARRKRISEYTNLLLQYDRLLARRETFAKPREQHRFGIYHEMSNRELVAVLDSLRVELVELDEQEQEQEHRAAIAAERAALPVTTAEPLPPSLHTQPISDSRPSAPHTDEPKPRSQDELRRQVHERILQDRFHIYR